MATLHIKKTTDGYFEFILDGDSANKISNTRNDLTAIGPELHFKTSNGANLIQNQQIYPGDVTLEADGNIYTFSSVEDAFADLKTVGFFDWMAGDGTSGTGGVNRFQDLLDTFKYLGNNGKTVKVNETLQRLEPVEYRLIKKFTDLDDTPQALSPNKMIVTSADGSLIIFKDLPVEQPQYLNSVGSFRYEDLTRQTQALTVPANTDVVIPNDAAGAKTNLSNAPFGIYTIYIPDDDAFDFSSLSVGDTLEIRIDMTIRTSTNNQTFNISAIVAQGSANEERKYFGFDQLKNAGLQAFSFSIPFDILNSDVQNNPAQIIFNSDASCSITFINYYVEVIRKNINVVELSSKPYPLQLVTEEGNTSTFPIIIGDAVAFIEIKKDRLTIQIAQYSVSHDVFFPYPANQGDAVTLISGEQLGPALDNNLSQANAYTDAALSAKEDKINKGSIVGNESSTTIYPYVKAVVDYVQNKINAIPLESDTLQSVTSRGAITTLAITANSFIKSGGLSNQFLKADGSIDNNFYLTAEIDTLQTVTNRNAVTTNTLTANGFIKSGGLPTQFLKADGSLDNNAYLISENDTLQSVTNRGATTTKDIVANSFIKSGGVSYQFLKADGTVDSTTYQPLLINPITGTGVVGQIAFFLGPNSQGGDSNLFWDNINKRLGIGTSLISSKLTIQGESLTDGGQLGTEILTIGSGINWIGSAYSSGYTHTTGSTSSLTSNDSALNGNYYYLSVTITGRTAGSINVLQNAVNLLSISSSTVVGFKATATAPIIVNPTTDFNGTVILSLKIVNISTPIISINNSTGTLINEFRNPINTACVYIGLGAGSRELSNQNVGIGFNSSANNITGSQNVSIGSKTLFNNTDGRSLTAIGYQSLLNNINGRYNSSLGDSSLYNNTTGNHNIGIGLNSLYNSTNGSSNVSIGNYSLFNYNFAGGGNTAVGYEAGRYISDGTTALSITDTSVFLGQGTKAQANSQTNQIVIGYAAIGNGSNTVTLGNSSITATYLQGNLGIASSVPTHPLTLSSTAATNGIALYNTADQTTNFERLKIFVSSNTFAIQSEQGGTGQLRPLLLNGTITANRIASSLGYLNMSSSMGASGLVGAAFAFNIVPSTGIVNAVAIFPTINATSAGGYRCLWISPYEQAVGSGQKLLIDLGTNTAANGGGTHTSKFTVDNQGNIVGLGLTINSTTQGSMPFPRMTQAQRTALTGMLTGTHVYQTDGTEGVYCYKSTGWVFAY